jgi:hypothetical protein
MTHWLLSVLWALGIGLTVAGLMVCVAYLRLAYLRWKALRAIDRVIQRGRR